MTTPSPMLGPAELLRLIHNLIQFGTVAEVDTARARVRVQNGELRTGWRPWIAVRAGATRDWNPPTVGEQVVLFSPGGDPASGIALTGIYSDQHPAPSASANLWQCQFPDGGLFEYDHESSVLRIKLPGRIEIDAPGGTSWNGDIDHQGNRTRAGNSGQTGGTVTHNGKNIGSDHQHGGVESGPSKTGEPV